MYKEMQQVLKDFPEFFVTRTKRHYRVSNPLTGDFVITPSSPSGHRYVNNFRADLKRLRRGCGYQTKTHLDRSISLHRNDSHE